MNKCTVLRVEGDEEIAVVIGRLHVGALPVGDGTAGDIQPAGDLGVGDPCPIQVREDAEPVFGDEGLPYVSST